MSKGKLNMSLLSKRLVSIAASTVLLSLVSASAHADTDVLTLTSDGKGTYDQTLYSRYTFQNSMILNSIGFLNYNSNATMSYSINGGAFIPVSISDPKDAYDLKWLTLNQSVSAGTVLRVKTENTSSYSTASANSGTNVVYGGMYQINLQSGLEELHGTNITNSNLRVSPSNPGSNVAPEPGSFALALTGGVALIGICIRRRRNAG